MEPEVAPVPAPAQASPPRPVSRVGPHLRLVLLFYGVVSLFAFGFALFSGDVSRLLGESTPRPEHLLAGLAVGLVLALATQLSTRMWAPLARAARVLTQALGAVTVPEALVLAAVSGVAEELLFRGALWPALGLAGTSLLFGLVHVVPRRALWIYPFLAAAVGVVLGLLRQSTGSVFPPMLAHAALNALNLAWIGRRARSPGAAEGPPA